MLYANCLRVSILVTFIIAGSSARAASSDDACALVTAEQVGAATKTTVTAGKYVSPTFKKTCTWTVPHAATPGVKIVTLSFESPEMFAAGLKADRNAGVSATSVSGIGDSAYYLAIGNIVSLHVKKGSVALKVAVYAQLPAEQIKAMEKTLAANALPKL